MNDQELLSRVRNQFQFLAGFEGDQISADRETAWNYYFQRPRGDEVEGRSKAVSGDLSAMVESNMAQMLEAVSGKRPAEFHAQSAADEDQALLESAVVQNVLFDRNNGFITLAETIKECLLARNCFVKVWNEDKQHTEIREYENASIEAVQALVAQQRGDNVEVEVLSYDEAAQRLRIKITGHRRRLRVKLVQGGNFFYFKDHDSLELQSIPICAERHVDRRSDLLEMGFPRDRVDRLPAHAHAFTGEAMAKAPGGDIDTSPGIDRSQDQIEWFEVYARVDKDEDGISELHRVSVSHDVSVLLEDEIVGTVPYAVGAIILNPGRLTSISLFDKLRRIQDRNTGLERALYDNVNAANKNRLAYIDGRVNEEDIGSGRINGGIRVRDSVQDVRQAVSAFQVPDLSAGILQNIEHVKRERTELGGAALDLASGTAQIGGSNSRLGSEGLDRAYSVMEQIASLYTKTLANTLVRQIYLLIHRTLRENYTDAFAVKVDGRWRQTSPSQWPERETLTINLGKPPGERARIQAAMGELNNMMLQLSQLGMDGVLVSLESFYSALLEWARIAEIPNPERFLIDPQSAESQEAQARKSEQAQRDAAARQALARQAIGLEQIRTAMSKYTHDTQLQFDYWKETLDAEAKEAELVASATVEALKQGAQKAEQEVEGNAGINESESEPESESTA